MTVHIIGAGLAGLLAGRMLHNLKPVIFEAQKELPNNHSAVLRFRSSTVGDVLGIPFRRVTMVKTALPWRNPVADAMAYSFKNTGSRRSDRSIIDGNQVADRFIAPPDLIARMAEGLDIRLGCPVDVPAVRNADRSEPAVSTMPMPSLMRLLGYDKVINFKSVPGINIKANVPDCDAYISVSIPDPDVPISRISLTGNELIVECPNIEGPSENGRNDILCYAMKAVGLEKCWVRDVRVRKQQYSKILPIDEDARREFIYWASHEHNIYSLGRYATWRPKLLLDDLVKDIRLIEGWIQRADRYAMARAR